MSKQTFTSKQLLTYVLIKSSYAFIMGVLLGYTIARIV